MQYTKIHKEYNRTNITFMQLDPLRSSEKLTQFTVQFIAKIAFAVIYYLRMGVNLLS